MLDFIRAFGQQGATLLLGLATGAAWIAAIAAPNCSYDRLDHSRADGHVRQLIKDSSAPIGFILLAAGALAILGGAFGAGICGFLAAFGFFSNRWTLSTLPKSEAPAGVRRRRKSQRVVAVALTLMFTFVALVGAILAAIGV
ncbi:MAG: hypothetical protein AAGF20_07340 [Pseudomonadota bacterium]